VWRVATPTDSLTTKERGRNPMKIQVIDPRVTALTPMDECVSQFIRCAYAAGISRGRVGNVYLLPEAEELLKKLLGFRPNPHESVLEHSAVSFLFQCSRIATHEIVRHRLCAFTQSSTRYIEEKDAVVFVKPPHMFSGDVGLYTLSYDESGTVLTSDSGVQPSRWVQVATEAVRDYQHERDQGVARESARYLLPHCLKADIVVTANFRQWRHMIRLRTSKKAAPEMQTLFNKVKDDLSQISPVLVEDL